MCNINNKSKIIKNYLKFLRKVNQPLYDFEIPDIRNEFIHYANIIEQNQDIKKDILYLNDKNLCIKYGLEPRDIHPKYVGLNVEQLKDSWKINIRNMITNGYVQLKLKNK